MDFKKFLLAVFISLTLFPFAFATYTVAPNGSFETGDLSYWTKACGNTAGVFTGCSGNYCVMDGTFGLGMSGVASTSVYRQSYCTSANVLTVGTWDINFNWGTESNGGAETFWISAGNGCSFNNNDSDTSTKKRLGLNYAQDRNMNTSATQYTFTVASDTTLCFSVSDNSTGSNSIANSYFVDYVLLQKRKDINAVVTEPVQPVDILTSFDITTRFFDVSTGDYLTNSELTSVSMNFNSEGASTMTYLGAGVWSKTITGRTPATYSYTITATGSGYNNYSYTDSVQVNFILNTLITATAISNNTLSVDTNTVLISPSSESGALEYKVTVSNSYGIPVTPNFKIYNSLRNDNKQYFIYTSNNGSAWTFSDTLTYGSTTANPIQKIWDAGSDKYYYYFTDSLASGETKYYKLTYEEVPFSAISLIGNGDWITIPNPDAINEGDLYHSYDVFNDSNYTNLQIYSIKKYSELTGSITNKGYELQFTAYADTSPATVKVGYRVGGTDTTTDVNVTTTKTRYSFPINTNNFEAQLLIKTANTSSNRIYFSDYAIVPRSYFAGRLELFNQDGSVPKSILRNTTYSQYLQEGTPFKFNTSAYNRDSDLTRLRIDAMIGSVIIKSYYYDLTQDATKKFNWNELIDGVIDYNGVANKEGILEPLRSLTVRAVLVNGADQNVAEQYKTISLLQYPYFPSDLQFKADLLIKKVGENPKVSFYFQPKQPEQIIAFDFIIYDSSHSKASPNYSTRVYLTDLGCSNLYFCQKEITLNEYNFEEETNYNIGVVAILKTEAQTYLNPLTQRFEATSVSYSSFETARLLQVFERRNGEYTNFEEIPLVLQIRDDTYKNLKDDFVVYLHVDINNAGDYTEITNPFYPSKYVYDSVTGYNYWYFNSIFFDDAGNLMPDGNALRFKAYVVPTRQTQASSNAYGLVNKCATYPSDFYNGTLLMNWIGVLGDVVYGCTGLSEQVVTWDDLNAVQIDINASYSPSALQTQNLICLRANAQQELNPDISEDLVCAIIYTKSEEQIDNFKIKIGNNFSDYSITDSTKQYIEFTIPQEQVMFNDILMMKSALENEFETDRINTLGEFLGAGFNKVLGNYQTYADFGELLTDYGVIKDISFDLNLSEQLNPNTVHGVFFITINGMKVTNFADYLSDYPELADVPPSSFKYYMMQKNVYLPKKETNVSLVSSDFKAFSKLKIDSSLIINEKATQRKTNIDDTNANLYSTPPASLKFQVISDMQSANQTKNNRSELTLWLSYFVPVYFSVGEIVEGLTDFVSDPINTSISFVYANWFLFVILIMLAVIVSVVYMNLKGNKPDVININNKGR